MSEYVGKFLKGPEKVDPIEMPGSEGSCPSEGGQSDGAPQGVDRFLGSPEALNLEAQLRDSIQKPGQEGSHSTAGYRQGDQVVPPAPLGEFLQGPDPMKTRVAPAKGEPGAGMGKGA